MLKKHLLLLCALFGGAVGFLLRFWQLNTVFDLDGLPIRSATATLVITVVSLLLLALFAFFAISFGKEPPIRHTEPSAPLFVVLLLFCAAGALSALSAVRRVQEIALMESRQPMAALLPYLLVLLSLCSALAFFSIAFRRYRKQALHNSLALLLPAFSGCIWLMASYQTIAGDPFLTDYAFGLFAIMSALLAHYFIAAHSFQKARPIPIYFCAATALYFSLTALSGRSLWNADSLLLLAQACYFAPTLLLLARDDPSMEAIPIDLAEQLDNTSHITPDDAASAILDDTPNAILDDAPNAALDDMPHATLDNAPTADLPHATYHTDPLKEERPQ